jgi:hypothetical protein
MEGKTVIFGLQKMSHKTHISNTRQQIQTDLSWTLQTYKTLETEYRSRKLIFNFWMLYYRPRTRIESIN